MGPLPSVTAVVVTYNAAGLVLSCLDALSAQDYPRDHLQCVVIDNASSDGTADLVASRFPDVHVIRSEINLGFAGANALALDQVTSTYVVLVNNDAVLSPDAITRLVRAAESPGWERVGAVTARVLLAGRFREVADGPVRSGGRAFAFVDDGELELVNSTGNMLRTDGYGVDRGWLAPAAEHKPSEHVFGFCGAAALLRVQAVRDAGSFDPALFMYYEDTDLSWRLRLRGWDVRHCSGAVVHHEHAASSGEGSDLFRFYNDRNRLVVLAKNGSLRLASRCLLRYPLTSASIALREWPDVTSTRRRLAVMRSFLQMLPRTLRARRRIGSTALVSRSEVERLLVAPSAEAPGAYRNATT